MSHTILIRVGLLGMMLAVLGLRSASVNSDETFTAGAPPRIAQAPLYLRDPVPPLNMLVLGKDHKLYYEAYNDASDLNGDGVLDVGYMGWKLKDPVPETGSRYEIDYFGLFGSYLCYAYTNGRFEPTSRTEDKTCPGTDWSGDFLNYLTTSRMDALRRVLYGGDRIVDTADETVLERVYVTQDAHSWGKEYESESHDGYDIADYTPYSAPAAGRHLFASTTLLGDQARPLLRVLQSSSYRIWEWVSIERPVADSTCDNGGRRSCGSIADFTVRVVACPPDSPDLHDSTCRRYPTGSTTGSVKPTGILHDYGETDRMYFGLITGSQFNNLEGGVLRRNIGSFRDEVDPDTGVFTGGSDSIVRTLSRLRMTGFGSNYLWSYGSQNCPALGWRPLANGECRMWGNPIAEMMYEGLRYFSGTAAATPRYATGSGIGADEETAMGLPAPPWQNPYRSTAEGGFPTCAKPNMTVISDINPSYDSALPGNAFGETSDTPPAPISGFNAAGEGARIWGNERLGTRNIFIGQSGADADGAPTAKSASSFGNIRGLAPEEPTKQGSYYAASVASYGFRTDVNGVDEAQSVSTFAVAVASPLPKIEFPVGDRTITLVPFAKSIAHPGRTDDFRIPQGVNDFRPTNTIVDFYVESLENLPGAPIQNGGTPRAVFRINYEDVEQGNDHDMDVIVRYELTEAAGGNLAVRLTSEYQAGSVMHHVGYVISGTTQDGTYLEVRDNDGNSTNAAANRYKLDTPPGVLAGGCDTANPLATCPRLADNTLLPLDTIRTFSPGSSSGAELLNGPLWYAAKYGGYEDANDNGLPDGGEWDRKKPGTPDNYFLVTNPLNLRSQLAEAFDSALAGDIKAGNATVSGARVGSSSFTLQPMFKVENEGKDWFGNLTAIAVKPDGSLGATLWNAQAGIPEADDRNILTITSPGDGTSDSGTGITAEDFVTQSGDNNTRLLRLGISPADIEQNYGGDYDADDFLAYIAGDQSNEISEDGTLRDRNTTVLGSIINSEPVISSPRADFGYGDYDDDMFDGYANTGSSGYLYTKRTRTALALVGANDGMLHAFNANTVPCSAPDDELACPGPNAGREEFAFVPNAVLGKLGRLALPNLPPPALPYEHEYYVDGQIAVGDAKDGTTWKTLAIGSTGGGASSIFALDISDSSLDAGDVLWERNGLIDNDIGNVYGKPLLVPLENDDWGVLFGNGYGGNLSDPSLYVLDAFTGEVISKITATDADPAEEPSVFTIIGGLIDGFICNLTNLVGGECARTEHPFNGLGQITAIDRNGNGKVDTVYGGDLQGNLWKFDLRSEDEGDWGVYDFETGGRAPLFTAATGDAIEDRQPITGGIRVAAGPGNGVMVYFGTGRYFVEGDNDVPAEPQVQSLYAIFDNGPVDGNEGSSTVGDDPDSAIDDRANLVAQSIIEEVPFGDFTTRNISRSLVRYFGVNAKRGWYLDLKLEAATDGDGERFIATPRIQSGRVFFSTYTPKEDSCNPGGTNFQYGLDLLSGAGALANVEVLPDGAAACTDGSCGGVAVTGADGEEVQAPIMNTGVVAINPVTTITSPACDPSVESCPTFEECQVVIYPGAFVLPRPCGRQSWRQLK
jgi:type IV pilus assembly protein PilY1